MTSAERTRRAYSALEHLLAQLEPRTDARTVVRNLTDRFASPAGIIEAPKALLEAAGLPANDALLLSLIPALARYTARETFGAHPLLSRANDAAAYLATRFTGVRIEHFYVLCLDQNGRLIEGILLQRGTTDSAPMYVRHVLAEVVRTGASAIVAGHNHPGNTLRPSRVDIRSTVNLIGSLYPLQVPLLDHIIIADSSPVSMRAAGVVSRDLWESQMPDNKLVRDWLTDYRGL